ncbi:hypothetical protein HVA01_27370 [Halovibrio variabilis]|uniref:Uncharacterized protein n=1 Tax=Halovibrio variabilis TaxID=31910 RepID=A0A511USW2_9GAMM|nr:SIR2 family protein [Halovibrio variabilis]GEN29091.1 hypothetical protein HVA01_27370 [Halovibrio variabilis]
MTFKQLLSEHFNKFSASPFLFVGSGMSRRYMGAENWEDLLKRFCELIGENYTKIRSQADGDLTKIASVLARSYSEKWWDSEIKGNKDVHYAEHLLKSDSPLKVEISGYLKRIHENVNEEYREEIELLKSSKIDGVITTNWDLFLESLFSEFSVFIGQEGLFASRNYGIAEIYKIHGSCKDPNSLILTNEDYEKFRKKNPYLSSKLLTVFVEHPIIFLGYSLTDPHILEILEEIVECIPENKMDALKENIIFVEWAPELDKPTLTESVLLKTLPVNLIRAASYRDIFEVLSEVKRRIPAHIFRQIKDELYDLILTNDPKGKLYVKEADDVGALEGQQEFVVGYGAISKIKKSEEMAKQGLIGLSREDIVRDVVFDNGGYDSASIVFDVFPNLIKGQINIPVFKYLNASGLIGEDGRVNENGLCDSLVARIRKNVEHYRPSGGEERRATTVPQVNEGIEQLYNTVDFNLFLRMAVFVPPDVLNLGALEKILKKHADDDFSSGEKSQFIKIVCVYDLVKYSRRYGPA